MKQRKLSKSGLFGFVALIALSCMLCSVVLLFSPDSSAESEAATEETTAVAVIANDDAQPDSRATAAEEATTEPTEEPTDEPIEEPTEEPTVEPTLVPTTAPRPTATRRPTATPRPTEDADLLAELAYTVEMRAIGGDYVEALEGISTQSEMAADNPYLILTDEWKIATVVYLVGLQTANERIRELEPPARYVAVHRDMLEAADYFDLAAEYYIEGVDDIDSNKMQLATVNMQLGTAAVGRATEKLEAMDK